MTCLICNSKIILQMNWTTVLQPKNQSDICQPCYSRLHVLKGNRCRKCGRESTVQTCSDCEHWENILQTDGDPLVKNISLYAYNSFIKDIIVQWKYRGDYILGDVFREDFRTSFYRYFNDIAHDATIVPIPLSKERLKERSFNQASRLASFLTDEIVETLARTHNEKQSKKSKQERMTTINPFKLQRPINKTAILVDDIYTTGRTLRHAAHILKENGCKEIYAYTLIRG